MSDDLKSNQQTTVERCEWNPTHGRAAYTDEPSACQNVASWCVGANGRWHLCATCAAYPAFSRLKKISLTLRLEAKDCQS